jgi:protein AroM
VPQVGFVTIGQSPRNDVLDSMLPTELHRSILQQGALDTLSPDVIQNLRPVSGEVSFVTRLADTTEVLVSKHRLMPHLQRAVDQVVGTGAEIVVILCTGAFPEISAPVPVVFPDRVLKANVDALLPEGVLGVVMPHQDQMETMRSKWESDSRRMVGLAASPYSASDTLANIGRSFQDHGVDMIVLDCMGFTLRMKALVGRGTTLPVILANRLVGRVIEEIVVEPVAVLREPL